MADVEINIGNDGGRIDNSPIRIGDVTGKDKISDNRFGSTHTDELFEILVRRIEILEQRSLEHDRIINEVEKLLGGNLGIPGLTTQVLDVKEMTLEIKQEIVEINAREHTRISYGNFVVLSLSVGAMCISVLATALGLWR